MRHARPDYMRFQDPAGKIPADEPVFLLRAQDACAAEAVEEYAMIVSSRLGDPDIISAAYSWAGEMRDWAAAHGEKMPDLPSAGKAEGYFAEGLQCAPFGACDGCGSVEHIDAIRARGELSCCPERKMLSAAEWMARARSAEAAMRPKWADEYQADPDELAMIFVVHPSYRYAAPADRDEWATWYVARWTTHNGGGWIWSGMLGQVVMVAPMPASPDHQQIIQALAS